MRPLRTAFIAALLLPLLAGLPAFAEDEKPPAPAEPKEEPKPVDKGTSEQLNMKVSCEKLIKTDFLSKSAAPTPPPPITSTASTAHGHRFGAAAGAAGSSATSSVTRGSWVAEATNTGSASERLV